MASATRRRRDSRGQFLPEFGLGSKAVSADVSISTMWYQKKVDGLAADVGGFSRDLKRLGRRSRNIKVMVHRDGAEPKVKEWKEINLALGRAARGHAHKVLKRSKQLVPVDTGLLKSTGRVHKQVIRKYDVIVTISYDTKYAIYVHEILEAWHAPPTMAKFLEIPVKQSDKAFRMAIKEEVRKFVISKAA